MASAQVTSAKERYASGAWLTPPLMTFTAVLVLAGTIVSLGFLFFTATGTLDRLARPLGTDFSSFWTAGRMALEGNAALAYDWTAHSAMQKRTHGIEMFFPWSYPPSFLLVAAAFAALPYASALFVWQGVSMLAALAAFRAIIPAPRAILFALAFPAVLVCAGHGQTGFLTAALIGGGVLLLPRYDIWAGVCFGLLAYKPQFGLLIPFVLLAGGYWRAIASATVTVLATVAITTALWGWPVWQAFFDSIQMTQKLVFETGNTGFEKFQSIFAWVGLWGGPLKLSYGLQGIVTLFVLAATVWIWWSPVSHRLKGAALLTGVLLSSPYVLDYDLPVFGLALAFFVAHGMEKGFGHWEKTAIAAAWIMPIATREFSRLTYVPIGFLALATIFLMVLHRAYSERWAEQAAMAPDMRPSEAVLSR